MNEKNVAGEVNSEEINDDVINESNTLENAGNTTANILKVKADPSDILPEDRKRNVKKLAGAISHSLRNGGEVNIRCFGSASISKAAKALSIANNYIKVQNLKLECSPAFITTKIDETNLTGIAFCTFATTINENTKKIDMAECKSVLKVSSDPKETTPEDRRKSVKKLAGAITHALEENKEVVIRCFGSATIGKAAKALAIARGYVAVKGGDLYCSPDFIVAKMGDNNQERTGIAFYAYTNGL